MAGWLGHGDHGLSVAFAVQACGGSGQCVRHGNDNGGWATAATRPRSDWVRRSERDVVAGSSGRTATVQCLSGECPLITTRIVRVRPPTVDCLVTGDSSDTLSVLHHGVSNTFRTGRSLRDVGRVEMKGCRARTTRPSSLRSMPPDVCDAPVHSRPIELASGGRCEPEQRRGHRRRAVRATSSAPTAV